MAAPTFVASEVAGSTSSSTLRAITKPAGTADGDLLIAFVTVKASTTVTAPSGWTLVTSSNWGTQTTYVYRKAAGAAEPADYTWTFSASVVSFGSVTAYRDANTTGFDAIGTGSGSSTTLTAPSVTSTVDDVALLRHYAAMGGYTIPTPTGHTERYSAIYGAGAGSGHGAQKGADKAQAAAGASGTAGVSISSSADWHAFTVAIAPAPNVAPNAPTALSPDGVTIDRTSTRRFSWTFSDPDSGDSQSQYDLRYRLTTSGTWIDVTGVTPNTFHDFASGTFAAGDYEWQVRTYDALGLVGPYSASAFFTAADPPAGPTITDPIAGGTISSEPYPAAWSTPVQDAYQVRTVADNAGSPDATTVYTDSGIIESSSARSRTVDFPVNNRPEHIQVRIRSAGLWSTWASINVNVSYTPPATPTVRTVSSDLDGNVKVEHTNPTPGVGEPTVTSADVWRRRHVYATDGTLSGYHPDEGGEAGIQLREGTGLAAGETFLDWSVASGEVYEHRVRVYGDNGTSTFSTWTL